MSKQTQANSIVEHGKTAGLDRQTIIDEICAQTGSGAPYAATLYRNANKAFGVTEVAAPDGSGDMTKFTGENLDTLRTEIQTAISAIADSHGITLKMKNISYDGDRKSFTTKIEANIGSPADKAKHDWNLYCGMYNLKSSDFGKTFTTPKGKTYKLCGINPKARKFPIEARSIPGDKEFGFPESITNFIK